MVDLNSPIKRGDFAMDLRTKAVVKVTEKGGRDWMVKPAYKADGYWVSPGDLVPTADPHAPGGKWFIAFLVAVVAGAATAFNEYQSLTGHGFGSADSFAYSVPSGALAMWLVRSLTGNIRL